MNSKECLNNASSSLQIKMKSIDVMQNEEGFSQRDSIESEPMLFNSIE